MNHPYPLTTDPPNAGVRLSDQTGRHLTQTEMYQRNNFPIPAPPDRIDVLIAGEPDRSITVAGLDEYEQVKLSMVLECAGNGRILMDPIPDGTPWDLGGASAIDVTGVRLADVLGPPGPDIHEYVFTGADSGWVEPEGQINYQFSLDAHEAMGHDPLLVTSISGEPLTHEHGAPIRLIVPGHYAMKSVKWLTRIEGVATRFSGHFVNKYRYFGDPRRPDGSAVGPMAVRSIISSPADGESREPGPIVIAGSAWSGGEGVARVEISLDAGKTWRGASLHPASGPFSAVRWEVETELSVGDTSIICRATSGAGEAQPLAPGWNVNGYANNVVHEIEIVVE